jgi:ABC-type transport system substrate-binding protein
VVIVASTDSVGRAHGDIAQRSLERLGFRTRLRILTPEAIVGGGCARAHVCASFGFQRDVPDAQSLLDPLFHGRHVRSGAGANVSRLDVPAINAAMDAARVLADPAERAGAWARVDAAVMDRFAVIPLLWSRQPLLRSADVRGVVHRAHATWDLSHTDVR